MTKPYPPCHYHDYLQLDSLLGAQKRRSEELGEPAHDEYLFIVVHQIYELWFRQILLEVDSIMQLFGQDKIADSDLQTAVSRCQRIIEIQQLLIDQVGILETMTPLDFLDFREYLYPASGFQSFQFRLLEVKLGLKADDRLKFNEQPFYDYLKPGQKQQIMEAQEKPSLFQLVENWLERTPFLESESFNFWQEYRRAVGKMFLGDKENIKNNPRLTDFDKTRNLAEIEMAEETFSALFEEAKYQKLVDKNQFRLSYKAIHAALLISLYRDQPILHLPFQTLTALLNVDELLSSWRYRHSLMAHRMLGTKIGTGGSAGHKYLRATTDKHKIFTDLFNLSTFFIPRSSLPKLPGDLRKELGFYYT